MIELRCNCDILTDDFYRTPKVINSAQYQITPEEYTYFHEKLKTKLFSKNVINLFILIIIIFYESNKNAKYY